MDRTRADHLLVARRLADSRTQAQDMIRARRVFSGDRCIDKPSQAIATSTPLTVRDDGPHWVSRGGQKLAAALEHFGISATGRICLDIGASTGGFTDVLLANGAARVYAIDVGHGQLATRLREDARVIVHEHTNARDLTAATVPEPPSLIVCDASFISLELVLSAPLALAAEEAVLVALIKPQFEVGKGGVGKRGVVSDPHQHNAVCARIKTWLQDAMGWHVRGILESPILGPRGNREFLIAAGRGP